MERVFYCTDCGQPFKSKATWALRCPKCRCKHEREREQAYRRRKKAEQYGGVKQKTINEVMRELEAYNKENHTTLSYGQYVLKIEGRRRNEIPTKQKLQKR